MCACVRVCVVSNSDGWARRGSGPQQLTTIEQVTNQLCRCVLSSHMGMSLTINSPPRRTLQQPYLGTYGDPRGVGVSYKGGTPVEGHLSPMPFTPPPFSQACAPQRVQGYLAHKKLPPPRTLPQAYAQGPRVVLGGGLFLMSEVALYSAMNSFGA